MTVRMAFVMSASFRFGTLIGEGRRYIGRSPMFVIWRQEALHRRVIGSRLDASPADIETSRAGLYPARVPRNAPYFRAPSNLHLNFAVQYAVTLTPSGPFAMQKADHVSP